MDSLMDNYALYSFEKLQLLQPHTNPQGIFKKGLEYFIQCSNLDVKPINSKRTSIFEVFDKEICVLGCKIVLVSSVPDEAIQMTTRTFEQITNLYGNPLSIIDFNKQLALLLPIKFPRLWIDFNHDTQNWEAKVERSLSEGELNVLENKLSLLCGYETSLTCTIDLDLNLKFEHKFHDTLSISISKHSSLNYSKSLFRKWEEDEQFWSDNKANLFHNDKNPETEDQKVKRANCLINGKYGEAHNIRNYLTLFNEIQIVIPIETSYDKLLYSLNITEEELVKLVEMNRVKLIFPHSIERYKKSLLENVVDINPHGILLSRELAFNTVSDLKRRNPIVFLPSNNEEKQQILSDMIRLSIDIKNINEKMWLYGFIEELSITWSNMHESLSVRGANGTFNLGLGPTINNLINKYTGKNYLVEIMAASQSIEWAAANNAVLCPVGPLANNEINLAYLYSGVRKDWNLDIVTSPNIATDGILTIANYVSVLELAESFNGREIEQFRQLLVNMTNNNSPEEINITINEFNQSVKSYERNVKRLNTWDVKGITLDTAIDLTNTAVPFAGFITKQLGRVLNHAGEKNDSIGNIIQQVNSKIHRTNPNVILVSGMRDKIKDLL